MALMITRLERKRFSFGTVQIESSDAKCAILIAKRDVLFTVNQFVHDLTEKRRKISDKVSNYIARSKRQFLN